jgi:hypothetical protein
MGTLGSFMRTRERFQRTEESSQRTLDGVQSPWGASRHEEFADQSPLPGMPCTVSALPPAPWHAVASAKAADLRHFYFLL